MRLREALVSAAVSICALALLEASGFAQGNLLGCIDGVQIDFKSRDGKPVARYDATIKLNDEKPLHITCIGYADSTGGSLFTELSHEACEPSGKILLRSTPSKLEISVSGQSGVARIKVEPKYKITQPNGLNCHFAEVSVALEDVPSCPPLKCDDVIFLHLMDEHGQRIKRFWGVDGTTAFGCGGAPPPKGADFDESSEWCGSEGIMRLPGRARFPNLKIRSEQGDFTGELPTGSFKVNQPNGPGCGICMESERTIVLRKSGN